MHTLSFGSFLLLLLVSRANAQQNDVFSLPIVVTPVLRAQALDIPAGRYTRLVVTYDNQSAELTLNPQRIDYRQKMLVWLKSTFVGDEKKSLLITAKADVGGVRLPEQPIYYRFQNLSGVSQQYYDIAPLTPYNTEYNGAIPVRIRGAYTIEVDSNIATSVMSALKYSSQLLNSPGHLLTSLSTSSFKDAGEKVDAELAKIFGNRHDADVLFDFDPALHESLNLSIQGNSKVIASIVLDARDSLIAARGDLKDFPLVVDDITKFKLDGATGQHPVSTIVRNLNMPVTENSTADQTNTFCETVAQELASRGLNQYDRAAVLFSYLVNSKWNRTSYFRTPPFADDACESRVGVLARTNLARSLRPRPEVDEIVTPPDTRVARLFSIRVRDPLAGVLRSKEGMRADAWVGVLAENLRITANVPVKLSNGAVLLPGAGVTLQTLDVPGALSEAAVIWRAAAAGQNCFGPFASTTTTSKFRSKKECSSVVLHPDDRIAEAVLEFEYEGQMTYDNLIGRQINPRLSHIHIMVPVTTPLVAAAAESPVSK
jgi:hypothetical protein